MSSYSSRKRGRGSLRAHTSRRLAIEILNVGQGDSILVRTPEDKTALIDAGSHKDLVADLLQRHEIDSLDLLVLSHHHQDHYGGMEEVIRRLPQLPRVFLDSGSSHTTPRYLRLLELIHDRGIPAIQPIDRPRHIGLGSVALTVFPRAPENPADDNDNSVGIRLQYGSFSVLLPGDAGRAERAWWEANVPELCQGATVLKLAHHGSDDGTDARWLGLVQPRLAVASVGQANDYGHPGSQTIDLLMRTGVKLLRTDRDGSVAITSDGTRWRVVGRRAVPV
jgi:beta-lactamase superfamily II metal-dependent hydrolase